MTPQEQLFVKYYNEKKIAIKDMSDLEIEVQREELSEIAAIARAGLTAIADEKASRKGNKTIGFERSINVDDITSNAINQIESRNKRLSKKEKIAKMLAEMDVAPEDIQQILSARGLRDVQAKSNLDTTSPASPARKESNKTKVEAKPTPGGFDWDAIIAQAKEQGLKPQEPEPFILNPFEQVVIPVNPPVSQEKFIETYCEPVIESPVVEVQVQVNPAIEPNPIQEESRLETPREPVVIDEKVVEELKPDTSLDFLNGLFQ